MHAARVPSNNDEGKRSFQFTAGMVLSLDALSFLLLFSIQDRWEIYLKFFLSH